MMDAWTMGGVGGTAALTFVAAGTKMKGSDQTALRINIPGTGDSLIGDVRFVGGLAALLASRWTTGTAQKALQATAFASGMSLLVTEVMRYQLSRKQTTVSPAKLPIFPSFGGTQPASQRQFAPREGAWAGR